MSGLKADLGDDLLRLELWNSIERNLHRELDREKLTQGNFDMAVGGPGHEQLRPFVVSVRPNVCVSKWSLDIAQFGELRNSSSGKFEASCRGESPETAMDHDRL